MVDNDPAGTPPANDPAQGGQQQQPPAASQQQHQPPGNIQQQPPQNEFIMNQDQFNKRWGERHGEIEKKLGMSIDDAVKFIETNKKQQKPSPTGETLSGPELRMAKMEALMTRGIPSKQIPVILQHFNIAGKTREEIDTSIQALIDVKLLTIEEAALQQEQQQPPAQQPSNVHAQGAGNPGVPPSPKIWTRAEIAKLAPEEYEKNRPDILKAMQEGRIKG